VITDVLAESLRRALTAIGVDAPETIHLERPARREHGDWSTNIALASAKAAGRNPRELAAELAAALEADPPAHLVKVEIAGPGFVNFHLDDGWLHDVLSQVVTEGSDYARPDLGGGKKVMVEFVSANPTGPLHAGHARGATYGDSLARLLERTGHDVSREFYVNDRGNQIQLYAQSLLARKNHQPVPEDGYKGDYIEEWAAHLPDDADPVEWGLAWAKEQQIATLARLGITFDTWFSERSLADRDEIEATLADLLARDAPDKPEDEAGDWKVAYEHDGATWLRSTAYGDDKDRVIVKSDGSYTYLLPDIAYHRDKFARGFDLLINVWGADHHGYVSRLKAAVATLGHDPDALEIIITQLVSLLKSGQPARLGKRTGTLITIDDILDEIGPDAARITFLLQSMDSPQTVDLDQVTSQAMENPVFYVQYAHARIQSIGRKAAELGVERAPLGEADLGLLTHDRELELLRSLSELPEVVAGAALGRAPHQVTTWVRELAGRFHGFYHDCYVVGDSVEPAVTQARLWLVEAVRVGLTIGLDLLGADAPDEM
jgi:arginyl-tRNA synthetase